MIDRDGTILAFQDSSVFKLCAHRVVVLQQDHLGLFLLAIRGLYTATFGHAFYLETAAVWLGSVLFGLALQCLFVIVVLPHVTLVDLNAVVVGEGTALALYVEVLRHIFVA